MNFTDIDKYENIPVSDKTADGMSFNSNDRQYLQRMFCVQDENIQEYINVTYDKHAKIITDVVREMLNEQKQDIFKVLSEIKQDIAEIKADIREINGEVAKLKALTAEHEFRLKHIEKNLGI